MKLVKYGQLQVSLRAGRHSIDRLHTDESIMAIGLGYSCIVEINDRVTMFIVRLFLNVNTIDRSRLN